MRFASPHRAARREGQPSSIAVTADGRQVLIGEGRTRDAELGMVRAFTVGSGESTEWPLNLRLETGCENFDRVATRGVRRMALSPQGLSIAFQQRLHRGPRSSDHVDARRLARGSVRV